MSNKQALRELQQRLAQRMQDAREQKTEVANWLAVECAGYGLLLSLKQAAEIFTPVAIKPVPYAKPWLVGVANLRGGLFTVVDLAMFLGLRESSSVRSDMRADSAQTRLVSLSPELHINCALLVDRLVGLRSDEQLTVQTETVEGDPRPRFDETGREVSVKRPRFAGPHMVDGEGRSWQQLHLDALSRHEQFLRVVV
ncbi:MULTISPECIES: chemotaxis protein CheW [Roseateles]|uniref:Chemotaxis protein CheW n=1 Tax=Roseateles albus TaxID=2987525 RepID=A0ABT5K9W9_9BURK|nr:MULTISPECIES: chemotaxis protein CheW [Roseateles]MCV2357515.1 chemotaxis protein CheW [Paucibacter sp. TC2R-5]MDC8770575.1 chemotaxis protein CheW [Roseateles albus]